MKKIAIFTLILLFLGAVLVVGCGGKEESTADKVEEKAEEVVDEAEETMEEVADTLQTEMEEAAKELPKEQGH